MGGTAPPAKPMSASSASSSATAVRDREKRTVKPNPLYPIQPGMKSTMERRTSGSAATSPSPSKPPRSQKGSQSATTPRKEANQAKETERQSEEELLKGKLQLVEERVLQLEEENKALKEEVRSVRDRLEEGEWGREMVEQKLEERSGFEKELDDVKEELVRSKVEREKWKEEKDKWRSELAKEKESLGKKVEEEVEKKLMAKLLSGGGQQQPQPQQQQQQQQPQPRPQQQPQQQTQQQQPQQRQQQQRQNRQRAPKKCFIFTDSNGQGATADSIKNHIPRDERDNYEIHVVVAHTLERACQLVTRGEVDTCGALVVIDNLTNDVRGSWRQPTCTPEVLVRRLDALRGALKMAAATIVCELKPMRLKDVTPYNRLLSDYLSAENGSGYGCRTQIRMEYLKPDGYHILPQFDPILDKTYACALLGISVPCPAPYENLVPDHVRRQYRQEWPRISSTRSEGPARNHGWSW